MPKFTEKEVYDLFSGLVATVSIGKKSGNAVTRKVAYADFPIAALRKVALKGMREFTDAIGGSDTATADKVKAFDKMVANYQNGLVGRQPSESVDDVTTIARSMAKAIFRKKDQAGWDKFIQESKATADSSNGKVKIGALIDARLDAIIAKNPKLRADAQAELDRRAESIDMIDLSL